MPQEIVFIGSSHLGLRCLLESPHFAVQEVLCLSERLTPLLKTVADKSNLPLKTFQGSSELRALVECHSASLPFFIYQLDMLVPADLVEKYAFYNVHRGNLRTNRGPNPDIWPILNGETKTELSLHKINEKVDSGILIDAFEVPISSHDDTIRVRERLERGLAPLIESLHDYLQGQRKGTVLAGGVYRPWVKESDFTLDLATDSLDVIDRKIRSQRQYNGALLITEGKTYYVIEMLEVEPRKPKSEFFLIVEESTIRTCSSSHVIVLKRNENPKYPPPPVRQPSKRI